MTPEELAAVLEEREACAKICADVARQLEQALGATDLDADVILARNMAERIRARGGAR